MKSTYGKVFKNASGEEFGIIRETKPPYPNALAATNVLAEDECGNYFIEISGDVLFWDHVLTRSLMRSHSNSAIAPSIVKRSLPAGEVVSIF